MKRKSMMVAVLMASMVLGACGKKTETSVVEDPVVSEAPAEETTTEETPTEEASSGETQTGETTEEASNEAATGRATRLQNTAKCWNRGLLPKKHWQKLNESVAITHGHRCSGMTV